MWFRTFRCGPGTRTPKIAVRTKSTARRSARHGVVAPEGPAMGSHVAVARRLSQAVLGRPPGCRKQADPRRPAREVQEDAASLQPTLAAIQQGE
jgi:hypothetical protein